MLYTRRVYDPIVSLGLKRRFEPPLDPPPVAALFVSLLQYVVWRVFAPLSSALAPQLSLRLRLLEMARNAQQLGGNGGAGKGPRDEKVLV